MDADEEKWLRVSGKIGRTKEENEWYNKYWDDLVAGDLTENGMTASDMIELRQYYDAGVKEKIENSYEYQKIKNMDLGSYAAMKGYDAINAEGHGKSGSYTVILNRTKLIIKEP